MNKLLILLSLLSFSAILKADLAASCDVAQQLDCSDVVDTEEGSWQLGVGFATALQIPKYIGSDESRNYFVPVPYISYNGPKLKVSQSGITGKLFNSERWYLSLSLSGAIPVDSDSNSARKGMSDLEAVFEYGPSLKYFFSGDDSSDNAFYFDFNFREARTLSFDSLDISSSPALVGRKKFTKEYFQGVLSAFSQFRWEFVSNRYADYFYGVASEFETEQRAQYKAKGGYAGYRLSQGLRWQKGNQVLSLFIAYADISKASYAESPLVKTDSHFYGGSAYFWLF